MSKWILIALNSLFLVSCLEFSGQLTLDQDTGLLNKRKKVINLEAGEYTADIKVKNKKKFEIRLNQNGDKEKFVFKMPKDFELPENGEFEISAEDSGQLCDLNGSTTSRYEDGKVRQGYESCEYEIYEYLCRWYQGPDGQMREWCRCYLMRYNDGEQIVNYFPRTHFYELVAALSDPVDGSTKGQFSGENISEERIYTHKGHCQPKYWTDPMCRY